MTDPTHPSRRDGDSIQSARRRRGRDGLRLPSAAQLTRRPGHAAGPARLDDLITLGMLIWLSALLAEFLFPYTHGWARWVLVPALGWTVLGLLELAGNLRQARRARRGRAARPHWPHPLGYAALCVAAGLVAWLGIIPDLVVPRGLGRPHAWPATAESGYRVELVTWREDGKIRYRAEAHCDRGSCLPLRGMRVDLYRHGDMTATDFCEREALTQPRRLARCEGRISLAPERYREVTNGRVTLYPARPVAPDAAP